MARRFAEPDDRPSGSGAPGAAGGEGGGGDEPRAEAEMTAEDLGIGRDEEDRLDALENARADPRRLRRTDATMFLVHLLVTAALIAIVALLARRHARTPVSTQPGDSGGGGGGGRSSPAGRLAR